MLDHTTQYILSHTQALLLTHMDYDTLQLGIQRMTITNPQRTTQQRHYKVTKDGNINLFAVGTGKGLM
eukprot:m.208996 g.208996  ORF g.208996 m.208996 type:complete len:68 (-) comp15043_c4_seq39:1458-1661(-)